ncbi:hypothetical protein, partial [Enterobacter hormaechei]|uniref:hypothetical protein n=1 Tax=Enterobacter hormaechei TaxID=158836 RepID=UPI001953690E
GWLVFLTHDIAAKPTRFGASPDLVTAALEGARRRGIDILPMRDALDRIGGAGPGRIGSVPRRTCPDTAQIVLAPSLRRQNTVPR